MHKLTFTRSKNNDTRTHRNEIDEINFEIDPDMNIWEMKTVCLRLCSAMGYTDMSIQQAFGSEVPPDDEITLEEFMRSLGTPSSDN
jgi:hypothetical protein